jgi:hypothetical protein
VPPEVEWPPPLDWTGLLAGACRVPELLDEFEFDEPDDFEFDELEEPELDEPDFDEPDDFELDEPDFEEPDDFELDEFEEAEPVDVELDEELPAVDLLGCVTAACVEPGSASATAPAAATLAKPTVAVVVFSRRLPRSRSATALDTSRARVPPLGRPPETPWRRSSGRDPWGRGAASRKSRKSGLSMLSVWHIRL